MSSRLTLSFLIFAITGVLSFQAQAIGILVPNGSASGLELVSHRVEVEVNERGARTKVFQEFKNNTGRQLEATYLFPLPKNATVDEFALYMNGKREVGSVMERKKARRIYESIVRRARDPGLIEYVDAQLFQANIFPIPPNGTQKVELTYTHLVDYEDGLHRYVYPMKTDQRASSTMKDFTLTVKVKSKLPIKNLYSPTHRLATQRKGNTGVASFEQNAFSLADDFTLLWSVDDKDVGLTLLTHKTGEDAGYFMLLASPKDHARDKEIIGKRVSFVVDTSGSMSGEKLEATKKALDYCVGQLGEDDLFNVITFGGYVETFSERMLSASSNNKRKARAFIKQIEALGGTNIDEALQTSLGAASGSKSVPHMVVFLTDGRPTVGETDIQAILKRTQEKNNGARIFVFGVGDDVNTTLLDTLALDAGGSATYLAGDATVEKGLKSFYDRISHPVLSNLSLNIKGVRTFGTHPRRLPDLFKGGQLVVLGRYRNGGKATITLKGQTKKAKQMFRFKGNFAKSQSDNAFVARLWAQRQVATLLQEIRVKGESKGLVAEVTQLATAFGIVTPYTSYLVVEPGTNMNPPPPPLRRPRRGNFGFERAEDEAGVDGLGLGGSGAGAASADRPRRKKTKGNMKMAEGAEAVSASKSIGDLRDSDSVAPRAQTSSVRVLGRLFKNVRGVYVDSSAKGKRVKVKAYSEAYFAILKAHPELKRAFALGERVVVKIGRGKVVETGDKGITTAKEAKSKSLL